MASAAGLLLILAACCLSFGEAFGFGLVNLDDYLYLLRHGDVVRFAGWTSVVSFFKDVSESIWMPLTWASYAADYALFGRSFGWFHVHSILIHAVNAFLVWRLLVLVVPKKGEGSTVGWCLIAALFWAIHPLRCESVVFLASRKDVLSFFWELLALVAWVRGSREDGLGRRVAQTSLAVLFFVIGFLCKPSVMTFPVLCLILDVLLLRRVRPLRYLVPFVLMLAFGAFAGWQQSAGDMGTVDNSEPLWARLLVACSAFGMYLKNTVWPFDLAVQCVKRWPELPRFVVPGVVISGLWGVFLLRCVLDYFKRRREIVKVALLDGCPVDISFNAQSDWLLAGMAWFAVAVAPMLGIASFGFHAFADRFTYIPSFGLALLAAAGLARAAERVGAVPVRIVASLLLVGLVCVTRWQTGFWRDDLRLFSRTVEVDGDRNDFAHKNLALYHFEITHDLDKAIFHFEKAKSVGLQSLLNVYDVYVMTLVELGRDDEAVSALRAFEDEVVRRFGADKAREILHGSCDDIRQESLVYVYRMARIAANLGKEPLLEEAKRELVGIRRDFGEYSTWQYLAWRCLTLEGDKGAADIIYRKLRDPLTKTSYAQYRFLSKRDVQ